MFFKSEKSEAAAVSKFRDTCTYHGLNIKVSTKALAALKEVAERKRKDEEIVLNDRDAHTLGRRGFIRVTNEDEVIITELGLLVIALAEAGGLVTFRAKAVPIKETANVAKK